jgi:hypothetical protein
MMAIPLIIILAGAVFYEYGYRRVQSELKDLKSDVSEKTKILSKYKSLLAERPQLEEALAAAKENRKMENTRLIEGQTPSVAAASLQNVIKGMITARGGTIASDRVEKLEGAGKFRIISVTFDAVMPDTRALADTLYAIETQSPYLVVRELDIRIRNFKEPRDLTVKLKVSGLTGG